MTRRLFLMVLLLGFCNAPTQAAGHAPRPLVIVLLPGTGLRDWQAADAPTLHRILATGCLAMMNTRTGRLPNDHHRESPESAALTLGAGSRAYGGSEAADFHPASARLPGTPLTFGKLYCRRAGTPPRWRALVNIEWPKVQQENSGRGYDLWPGDLGDGLIRHGITTLVGGGRFAPLIACDSAGMVDAVPVQQGLPARLPPFLVWDAGSDIAFADPLLRQAASLVAAQQGRLIVVSPFASDQANSRGERLTPVAVWGPEVPSGLLFSPSTHRSGLVTNTDVAPSVAAFFGATTQRPWLPVAALGRPWKFQQHENADVTVTRLETAAYRQASAMRLLPSIAAGLGMLILTGIVSRWRGRRVPVLLWLPGVVIFSLLVSSSPLALGVWVTALCSVCACLQARWGVSRLLLLTATLTVLLLVGDTLSGNNLMRIDFLGYSSIEGARYYGIGNEAMGALVGSALVAADALRRRHRLALPLVALALTGLTLLIGLPGAGAKAGGLLVAVAAFGAFLWTAWGKHWRLRVVASLLATMLTALALVAISDWRHGTQAQSHMGGTITRISSAGIGEAMDVVGRKLAVESRLLYHSAWDVPLWLCLFGLCFLARRIQSEPGRNSRPLLYGGAAAMLVTLAVNDAGVVAAAISGVTIVTGLLTAEQKIPQTDIPSGGR